MKNAVLAILAFFVLCISCKKKEATPDPVQTPAPTNSTTSYYGFLTAEQITEWGSGAPVNNRYFSSAMLTQTASVGAIVSPSYNGTVSLNGTVLKTESIGSYVYYLDTTNTLNLAAQRNFQFTSSTMLPSFTFNDPDAFPIYPSGNGYLVNDTLFKTQGLTLSLSGTSGYDEAACVIYEIGNASNSVSKVLPFGTSQFNISTGDLAGFTPGTTVLCGLSLKKYNTQAFSGKNFRFETSTYNNFYMIVQ
jgi:hypothetical protein